MLKKRLVRNADPVYERANILCKVKKIQYAQPIQEQYSVKLISTQRKYLEAKAKSILNNNNGNDSK